MEAVADSSFLISLARAGLLDLLRQLPFELVLLDVVKRETVTSGLAMGYADATAIDAATSGLVVRSSGRPAGRPVDAIVVEAATRAGLILANDLALGRRTRNLGAQWLRTADVVLLLAKLGTLRPVAGRAAIVALRDANRIASEMAAAYLGRLGEVEI